MSTIVIIDDDPTFAALLSEYCVQQGHVPHHAGTLEEGRALLASQETDLVFLDVSLPDGNGLDLLPAMQTLPGEPEVIIITGVDNGNGAELAIKNGAWDYLQKPLVSHEIILHIRRALEYREQKRKRSRNISLKRDNIIGRSKALSDCLDQVANCAATETGVLITGETGTGKELFARAIHANSLRADRPFVVVDCTSLPEQLVESILFGHLKGTFTGAVRDNKGLIEQADGGTLFLDEIGELPLETQKTFLRVLQDQRFRPLGMEQERASNFRLVAATNRDLREQVQQGLFRSDLFFRLDTFTIHLPPLRERPEDIESLAMHIVFSYCRHHNMPVKGIAPETLAALADYHWPGNIRELKNVLERVVISAPEAPLIYPVHLPPEIRIDRIRTLVSNKQDHPLKAPLAPQPIPAASDPTGPADLPSFREFRRQQTFAADHHYLQQLLRVTGGDITRCCRISGLSRSRLYGLLKEHRLSKNTG
ncbi:MAG: sigma-54-dependent transcriptional regulator [Desulfobulbus sp.]|jgi:two-component system NtrC family response regulator